MHWIYIYVYSVYVTPLRHGLPDFYSFWWFPQEAILRQTKIILKYKKKETSK